MGERLKYRVIAEPKQGSNLFDECFTNYEAVKKQIWENAHALCMNRATVTICESLWCVTETGAVELDRWEIREKFKLAMEPCDVATGERYE